MHQLEDEYTVFVDYPRPIVCTCGHALGHHDEKSKLFKCKRCHCSVFLTDWDVAHELGFEPSRPQLHSAKRPRNWSKGGVRWTKTRGNAR